MSRVSSASHERSAAQRTSRTAGRGFGAGFSARLGTRSGTEPWSQAGVNAKARSDTLPRVGFKSGFGLQAFALLGLVLLLVSAQTPAYALSSGGAGSAGNVAPIENTDTQNDDTTPTNNPASGEATSPTGDTAAPGDNATSGNTAIPGSTSDEFVRVERVLPLVVDYANLLTDAEEAKLIALFEQLSEEQKCEIAVVTVNGLEGKTAMAYADDFFDYNGYGYGPDDDGIMLLISMADRDWWVTTHGTAYIQLSEDRFNWLMEDVLPLLSSGDYYEAFELFGHNSAELMQMSVPTEILPPDNGNAGQPVTFKYVTVKGFFAWTAIGLGLGAAIAGVANAAKKSKHKTVRYSEGARSYLQNASLRQASPSAAQSGQIDPALLAAGFVLANLASALLLNNQSDVFVRTSTSRTARSDESRSSSSGGSSSSSGGFGGHTSSSGSTHGGGGGKF